jgi:hypothetical protein
MQSDPLSQEAWLQWNAMTWGLKPERVRYTAKGKDLPALEGVLYTNRRGHVQMPPLNAYLPFQVLNTNTTRPARLNNQWLSIAEQFAADLHTRGITGTIALPPGMMDARPFQWKGFNAAIRYTFTTALPIDSTTIENSVRKRITKAQNEGYTASRTTAWDDILLCLRATEKRKAFQHRLDGAALAEASRMLGESSFRGYVVRDQEGRPVSGGARIFAAGGAAIDWVQGGDSIALRSGVNQLIYSFMLDDLTEAGAMTFNYGGANLERVARAKTEWGFDLTPFLVLNTPGLRHLTKNALATGHWIRSRIPTIESVSMGRTPTIARNGDTNDECHDNRQPKEGFER